MLKIIHHRKYVLIILVIANIYLLFFLLFLWMYIVHYLYNFFCFTNTALVREQREVKITISDDYVIT